MRIPFDIKFKPQIESGEYKVETEAGSPAKVMDWEYNARVCGKCIAIKITEGDGDHGLLYTHEGKRASIFPAEEGIDLFLITPEPEFTEFEKRLWEIMKSEGSPIGPMDKFTQDDERVFHAYSNQLLELAKKEITDGWSKGLRDTQDLSGKAYSDGYESGLDKGKAEALKDLPRWKRLYSKEKADEIPDCIILGKALDNRLVHRGFELKITDLEKLPGFKEE